MLRLLIVSLLSSFSLVCLLRCVLVLLVILIGLSTVALLVTVALLATVALFHFFLSCIGIMAGLMLLIAIASVALFILTLVVASMSLLWLVASSLAVMAMGLRMSMVGSLRDHIAVGKRASMVMTVFAISVGVSDTAMAVGHMIMLSIMRVSPMGVSIVLSIAIRKRMLSVMGLRNVSMSMGLMLMDWFAVRESASMVVTVVAICMGMSDTTVAVSGLVVTLSMGMRVIIMFLRRLVNMALLSFIQYRSWSMILQIIKPS